MNASDYRAYRDMQVLQKELSKPKTSKEKRTTNYTYKAIQSSTPL